MESGMDPEVRRYFRKIVNSFSFGLMWLMMAVTAGLFFDLGPVHGSVRWYNLVFYGFFLISLAGLLYYLYRVWKR